MRDPLDVARRNRIANRAANASDVVRKIQHRATVDAKRVKPCVGNTVGVRRNQPVQGVADNVATPCDLRDHLVSIRITHIDQSDPWIFVGNYGKTRVIGEMHMRHQPDNVFARRSLPEGIGYQQPRKAKHAVIALQQHSRDRPA